MSKLILKVDKWLKIILYYLAQLTILGFTIAAIFFIATSDDAIKELYGNNSAMVELAIQMKKGFMVFIWFLVPLSVILIGLNIWKIFNWIYDRKEEKRNGKFKNKKPQEKI